MGNKLVYLLGIGILVIILIVYIDQRYFFNPVVFSQDRVTTHSWIEYKRPLTLTYYNLEGDRQTHKINQEKKIRALLEVLKDCPEAKKAERVTDIQGALKLSNQEGALLEILLYKKHWEIIENGDSVYQVSRQLKNMVNRY